MEILVATLNEHKLREFARILEPLGYTVVSRAKYCPDTEVPEDGATFAENALIKATAVYRMTGRPCVADDSGLCVDALGGEPGVYSSRYAGGHGDDARNIAKLLDKMKNVPAEKRAGAFVCSVCCVFSPDDILTCEGRCEGRIAFAPAGEDGFGYDPVFLYGDGDRSIAQMSPEEKDAVSHRGRALRALNKLLIERGEKN